MAEVFSGNLKSLLMDFTSSSGESQAVKVARDSTDQYDIMDFQDEGTLPSGMNYSFESVKNPRTGLVERGMYIGDVEMVKSGDSYQYFQTRNGKKVPISSEEAIRLLQPGLSGLTKLDANKMNALIKSTLPAGKETIAHPKYKGEIPEYFDEERIFYDSFGKEPVSKKKENQELLIRDAPSKVGR